MKIYTQTFDANRPTLKQINIPNYSNAKIGIEVIKNGEPVELTKDNVKLTSGDTVLSADDVYSGYVTVPVTVGDCGNDTMYKVEIDKETTLIDTDIKLVTPAGTPTGTVISAEYSLSDMVGQELNADSVQVIQRYNDDIELFNFLNIIDNNGRIIKAWQSPKTQGSPAPEPVWGDIRTTTGRVKSIKVEDGWRLASWCSASPLSTGKTREIKIKQTSTYSNSFKLVINSVKSSVIDVAEDTEIPVATTETVGGVKVGNGLTIDDDGTLKTAGGYIEEDIILDMSKMETEGPTYEFANLQPGKSYRVIADETTAPAIYEWGLNIEPDTTAGWKLGDKCRIYFSPRDTYSDFTFRYINFASNMYPNTSYWYGDRYWQHSEGPDWRANGGFCFELTYNTIVTPNTSYHNWIITGGSQDGFLN